MRSAHRSTRVCEAGRDLTESIAAAETVAVASVVLPLLRPWRWTLLAAFSLNALHGIAIGVQTLMPKWLISDILKPPASRGGNACSGWRSSPWATSSPPSSGGCSSGIWATCDRLIVLRDGRIEQEGTFASLVSVPGLFREMVAGQKLY